MSPTNILFWQYIFHWIKDQIKAFTKPPTAKIALGTLSDLSRSRADLIAENAFLRQQLIIINRQIKRPQFTNRDRLSLVLLARCTQLWEQAIFIIPPDTLQRWHRDLFLLFWRWKSKPKKRKSRITSETIDRIKQMADENRLWGAGYQSGFVNKIP